MNLNYFKPVILPFVFLTVFLTFFTPLVEADSSILNLENTSISVPSQHYSINSEIRTDSPKNVGNYSLPSELSDSNTCKQFKFYKKIGEIGNAPGKFRMPNEIAFGPDNTVYIADSTVGLPGNFRIQHFSYDGTYLGSFGSYGTGDGQFREDICVTVDDEGYVYATDWGNNRIQKFTSNGKFVQKWGKLGSKDGDLNNPHGIFFAPDGYLYVCDRNNNRIQIFTTNGFFVSKFGSYGNTDGQFMGPEDVFVNKKGEIYVVEWDGHRVQKFTKDYKSMLKWGTKGSKKGQFNNPHSVFQDNEGNIWVSDFLNDRVQKFSSNGEYLLSITSDASTGALIGNPQYAKIDKKGILHIGNYKYGTDLLYFNRPIIQYSISPTSGIAPLSVKFSDKSLGNVYARKWDFGDGETSNLKDVSHKYKKPGNYTVTLTIINTCGNWKESALITVSGNTPLSSQLIAYYSFDGGTAKDDSGHRNDGILYGPKLALGVKNYALFFNGKSNYISLPQIFTSNPKKITMMAWINPKTDTKSQKIIYNGNYESAISINKESQGNLNIGVKLSKDGAKNNWYSAQTNIIPDQQWIHVSGVIDTENQIIKLYQNGILVDQNSLPADTIYNLKNGLVRIGAYDSSTFGLKEYYEGGIDEIRIYKGALTDAEIKTIYESYNYGPVPTPTPTGSPTPTISPTPTPDPNPLEASFTATPRSGKSPLNVQFKDTSSGNPTSWSWTFGDGGTSIKQNPIHSYRKGGSYPIKLVVKRAGKSSQKMMSQYITVTTKMSQNNQYADSEPLNNDKDVYNKLEINEEHIEYKEIPVIDPPNFL